MALILVPEADHLAVRMSRVWSRDGDGVIRIGDDLDNLDVLDVVMAEPEENNRAKLIRWTLPSPTQHQKLEDHRKLRFLCGLGHARSTKPEYRGSWTDVEKSQNFPITCANGIVITLRPPDHEAPIMNEIDKTIDIHSGILVHLPPPVNTFKGRIRPIPWIRKPQDRFDGEVCRKFRAAVRMYADPLWLGVFSRKQRFVESAPFPFNYESNATRLNTWHQIRDFDSERRCKDDREELEDTRKKPINIVYDQVMEWREALDSEQINFYEPNIPEEVRQYRGGLQRWTPRYLRRETRFNEYEALRLIGTRFGSLGGQAF